MILVEAITEALHSPDAPRHRKELAEFVSRFIGARLVAAGKATPNQVRDWCGLKPVDHALGDRLYRPMLHPFSAFAESAAETS